MGIESLRRKEDGTVYARKCEECGAAWKIYQKPSHQEGCLYALQGRPVGIEMPELKVGEDGFVHSTWEPHLNLYLVAFRVPAIDFKILAPDAGKAIQEARKLIQRQQVHWGSELVIVESVTLLDREPGRDGR